MHYALSFCRYGLTVLVIIHEIALYWSVCAVLEFVVLLYNTICTTYMMAPCDIPCCGGQMISLSLSPPPSQMIQPLLFYLLVIAQRK